MQTAKKILKNFLRWTEKYTKTDMIYAAKGSFWTLAGKGILALVSIASLAAFANLLPMKTYGTYQFILSIASIAAISSLTGMGPSVTRSIAKGYEGSLSHAFKIRLKWSTLGSVGLIVTSAWYFMNNNPTLAISFLLIAMFFPFESASMMFVSFWQGKKRFDIQSFYLVISTIAAVTAVVSILFLTNNLVLIILTYFASYAIFMLIAYFLTLKNVKNNKQDKEMVPFGKHMSAMNVIGALSSHIDKVILWSLLGPIQVAIYTMSIMPIQKLYSFNPIYNIALPKLSTHGIKGEKRKKNIFYKFLILFTVTVPIAIILILIAPFVYKILFPQYLNSVKYFQVLCTWLILAPFTLLSSSFVAEMKTKFMYTEQITVPIIKIILFFCLAPFLGIWGLIIAILTAEVIRGGLLLYFFSKL